MATTMRKKKEKKWKNTPKKNKSKINTRVKKNKHFVK